MTAAGGRLVGISIDAPAQHAAMIHKLGLPFPLLSDPDRSGAIEPYGVADPRDPRTIARPATVVVAPDGTESFRHESRDFADRPVEDAIIEAVRVLGLPPTTQEPPGVGPAAPGPKALRLEHLVPYYNGAKFAVTAMARRHPATKEEADAYIAQLERYGEAAKVAYRAHH